MLENGFHINKFVEWLVVFKAEISGAEGTKHDGLRITLRRCGEGVRMTALAPTTAGLVLHFRTVHSTKCCLESLWKEGIDKMLLVDNSEDGGRSLGELAPELRRLEADGMRVVVVEPSQNLGFSAGVNRGLVAIRANFGRARVLLINSDAQLLPGALLPLQLAIDRGADLVSPVLDSPQGGSRTIAYYHRFTGLLSTHPWAGAFPHLSGCCLLLSESVAATNLLDEAFFFYGEDAFLGWRVIRDGLSAQVEPSAHVLHSGSGSSRRGSRFYEYHMARAHLQLARQLARGRADFWWLVLGRSLTLPLRAAWRAVRQRSVVPIWGLGAAVADFARGRIRSLTPPPSSAVN